MNIEGFLKLFVDDLSSEVGPLYYDNEIDISEDSIKLQVEDCPEVMVEVDTLLDHMDVYCVFPYFDYKKDERMLADIEDLEHEIAQYYKQKDFERALSGKIKFNVWEEDFLGCPGCDVCVGLRNVKCDILIVKEFINIYLNSELLEKSNNFSEIRSRRLERFFSGHLTSHFFKIKERENIDYLPIDDNCVVSYIGEEFVLLKGNSENAAIKKCYYDLFVKILEEMEYFSDYRIEIYSDFVRYVTCTYLIDILSINAEEAMKIETLHFNINLQNFLLFADGENLASVERTFNQNNAQIKDAKIMFLPHLYTEGQTDCIHIKNALKISPLYKGKDWVFDEAITNKGDKELLKLCQVFAKNAEPTCARIAIFDRDGSIPLKDIEDETKGFKDWGNRMYSFALPIPEHRVTTPNISIEHYYSNEEIFREYDIGGISRRLYMGCEFDNIGRAISLRKVRKVPNKCGATSIAILDSEVYDMDNDTNIDYALSKSKFAEKICSSEMSTEAFRAFNRLFAKIMEVLKYDEDRNIRVKPSVIVNTMQSDV